MVLQNILLKKSNGIELYVMITWCELLITQNKHMNFQNESYNT
jgi:hypothetical protein